VDFSQEMEATKLSQKSLGATSCERESYHMIRCKKLPKMNQLKNLRLNRNLILRKQQMIWRISKRKQAAGNNPL